MNRAESELHTLQVFPELANALMAPGVWGRSTRQLGVVARYAHGQKVQGNHEPTTRALGLCNELLNSDDPTVRMAAEAALHSGLCPDHHTHQNAEGRAERTTGEMHAIAPHQVPTQIAERWNRARHTPWP